MNGRKRNVLAGVGIALLVTAALVTVGALAFRGGQRHDGAVRAVEQVVADGEGGRTLIVGGGGWHGGWGGGPGFLLVPLVVVGAILLFRSGRGRWDGRQRDDWQDWHRQAHADARVVADAPTPPAPPPPPPSADAPVTGTPPASSSAPPPADTA